MLHHTEELRFLCIEEAQHLLVEAMRMTKTSFEESNSVQHVLSLIIDQRGCQQIFQIELGIIIIF
jgi:hypothetical protein